MLLSEYDRVVCLFVDRRYLQEREFMRQLLFDHGVRPEVYSSHLDGDGMLLPRAWYNQVTGGIPAWWGHGIGAFAHFNAMMSVVKNAKADGVETLLWVEDDCRFEPDFDRVVEDATRQLRTLPHWDILYYGANHTWARTRELTPNVLHVNGSYTTHCVGIQRQAFDRILSLPQVDVVDKMIAETLHPTLNCFAVWPNVAVQKPGFSYLSNVDMDYTLYFRAKGTLWV